jgi:hypothetical protein
MGDNRADAGHEWGHARTSSWHYGPCDYGRRRVGIGVSQNSVSKVRERLTATFQIEKFARAFNLARRQLAENSAAASNQIIQLEKPPS